MLSVESAHPEARIRIHHIFDPALAKDGRHAQLDIQGPPFFELDFAVLRLALFRNIQIAHDLQRVINALR